MIMKTFETGNEKHDADYYVWLMPYNRVVSDDQFTQALASGLSVHECHDRILDAECLLFETHNHAAWERGWFDAVDKITWLTSPANSEELGIADLLEMADDRRQELRRGCYATSLTTGLPELNEIVYSNTIGRCDCCEAGMMFVVDEDNDWAEISSVLRSTTDRQELRELAARQQAIAAAQMLRPIWTPYGYVRHDQIGGI